MQRQINTPLENRTKHTYRARLYDFIKDLLVVCPNCSGKALVKTGAYTFSQIEATDIRVVCSACGYCKILERLHTRNQYFIVGAPVDPFFHLPLWLKIEVGNQLLWAYNPEHLEFLAAHVGAKLRERNGFKYQVKSIGAKLPRWMSSKNNREQVLRAIEKLREK